MNPKKYFNRSIAMETTGVSFDHYLAKRRIKVSIVGKPNVGKSSLVNAILGSDRVLVHDQPHTTTDPVCVDFVQDGIKFRLVDTAGLESQTHIKVAPS